MNWHGDNLFVVDSIQYNLGKTLLKWFAFQKKIQHQIDSFNSMYDQESPKVTLDTLNPTFSTNIIISPQLCRGKLCVANLIPTCYWCKPGDHIKMC